MLKTNAIRLAQMKPAEAGTCDAPAEGGAAYGDGNAGNAREDGNADAHGGADHKLGRECSCANRNMATMLLMTIMMVTLLIAAMMMVMPNTDQNSVLKYLELTPP